jgi:hypothetical protein
MNVDRVRPRRDGIVELHGLEQFAGREHVVAFDPARLAHAHLGGEGAQPAVLAARH